MLLMLMMMMMMMMLLLLLLIEGWVNDPYESTHQFTTGLRAQGEFQEAKD
jgi:hypothetical protein